MKEDQVCSKRTKPEGIYAAILAGGSGKRMGNLNKPKQYLNLGDRPILIHTLEKFCVTGLFEKIIVLCPDSWIVQTRDIVKKYCPNYLDKIDVIEGGETRNDTILNALAYISETCDVDESSVIVTHDAVRPFVSYRIIEDNVQMAIEHGACDTCCPATDTIVKSESSDLIDDIPPRQFFYQGQTPQSFKVVELRNMLMSLTAEEKSYATDACKAYVLRGRPVYIVDGDSSNIKITYPTDILLAQALMGKNSSLDSENTCFDCEV